MKKSKFTEQQIIFASKQAETGISVEEVCRKIGISEAHFTIGKGSSPVWEQQNCFVCGSPRKKTPD